MWAKERAAELEAGIEVLLSPVPTCEKVFNEYLTYHLPEKCEAEQETDRRRAELWKRFLGANSDLSKIAKRDWQRFSGTPAL